MAGIIKVDRVQSDSNLAFNVGGSNVSFFNSTGVNIVGGEIIAGGSTLRATSGLLYANNGISFPSTQSSSSNPNTLDDYEEGTWTATLSNGGTVTAVQPLKYTKIGRVVHIDGHVNFSNIPSNGSIFEMHGLPFVVSDTYIAGSLGYVGSANIPGWLLIGQSGDDFLYFHVATGDSSRRSNSQVASALSVIIFSITYTTT
jgi:hypothetical protein